MTSALSNKKRTLNLRDMSAVGNTSSNQEQNTRKILMDLQQEKKRLRMMQQGNTAGTGQGLLPTPSIRPSVNPNLPQNVPMDPSQHMAAQQRTAMQMAHATSFGYYIPQDSAFGNIILPVIPRVGPRPGKE